MKIIADYHCMQYTMAAPIREKEKESETLSVYNSELTSNVFALQNSGVLCYLNSLIQSLMGCSSFNEYLILNKDKYKDNKIVDEYLKIYNANPINQPRRTDADNAFAILKELNTARKKIKTSWNLTLSSEEDIHEGMVLLLDSIGGDIDKLFHNRYKCQTKCLKCGEISTPGNNANYEEPPNIFIDLSEENPQIQESLQTKEQIEKYILRNVQIPRDYKCGKCGAQNTYNSSTKDVSENVIQVYSLVRLSEIIVLLFKKYQGKRQRYFPPTLDFKAMTGNLKYKLISQVEHSGSMSGGHYVAKCLRVKPPKFIESRKKKAEKYLAEIEKTMASMSISDSKKRKEKEQEYKEKIKDIKDMINQDELDKNKQDAVFMFNDRNITYCPEGFVPTPNTYMAFYHLYN